MARKTDISLPLVIEEEEEYGTMVSCWKRNASK